MQFDNSFLIQFALSVPLLAAFFAAIIPYRNVRDSFMVTTSLALPFFVFKIYQFMVVGNGVLEWK